MGQVHNENGLYSRAQRYGLCALECLLRKCVLACPSVQTDTEHFIWNLSV
jgi:hypothetical protein